MKNLWKIYRLVYAFFFTDLVGKESRPIVPLSTTSVQGPIVPSHSPQVQSLKESYPTVPLSTGSVRKRILSYRPIIHRFSHEKNPVLPSHYPQIQSGKESHPTVSLSTDLVKESHPTVPLFTGSVRKRILSFHPITGD